jgi:hypothetical protein
MHRRVHRDDRRAFGGAIAFHDAQAEFLGIGRTRFGAHLFRAGKDVAQRVEIIGMRHAGVARQERVRAEHDRGIAIIGQRRDDAVMQRTGIHHRANAIEQRQHVPREAKGMEHRQRVQHHVRRVEIDARRELQVGQQVAVAEHHALGHPSEPEVNSTTAGASG